jgi:hypothetical protein
MAAAVILLPGVSQASTHHKAKTEAQPAPDDSGCRATPEQTSIGIRALQTELMVAGLKCSAEQWNNFTAKFKTVIKTDADRMQRLFSKTYGKSGATQMNSFVTQLANDASQRSNQSAEADYCRQESDLFQKVLALTAQDLERFSIHRALAVPAPVKLCEPESDKPAATQTALVMTAAAPAAASTAAAQAAPAATPGNPQAAEAPKQNDGGFFGRLFK